MDCDVLISGAGPGGSLAAKLLADGGLSVAAVERAAGESFDRYHETCGAALSRRALRICGAKGSEILNEVDRLNVHWPENAVPIRVDGAVIDRPALARRLVEDSGAKVVDGSVERVSRKDGGCETLLRDGSVIRSRYVVGADGAFSAVRRSVFGTRPEEIVPVEETILDEPHGPSLDFYMGERYGGLYAWRFPRGRGSSIGSAPGALPRPPGAKVRGRCIPIGPVPSMSEGNVLLVGDAAGLPNPMTFGGLRAAFASAKLAAEAIADGEPSRYGADWRRTGLSDPRFMSAHARFSSMDDEELKKFSRHMTHGGLYLDGAASLIASPRDARDLFACLFALKRGWRASGKNGFMKRPSERVRSVGPYVGTFSTATRVAEPFPEDSFQLMNINLVDV